MFFRQSLALSIILFITTTFSCVTCMENNQQISLNDPQRHTIEEAFNKAKIVGVEKTGERFDACYTYAISHHLNIIGKAPELLKLSASVDLIRSIDSLGTYYQQTEQPHEDSLVVYKRLPGEEPTHFGIVKKVNTNSLSECVILSKWGLAPEILEHKLFETPSTYGTIISFFILKPEFKNDETHFLKDLQQKISLSPYIKKSISILQKMLLHLANGKNFNSPYCQIFNDQKTIHNKTLYLLKAAMGLSINTFRALTKETVLMLATKRNDLEMMQLFLSMNASTERRDINGNTALMIAERAGYYNAVKLLKEYGATE